MYLPYRRMAVQSSSLQPGATVLDLGCGSGRPNVRGLRGILLRRMQRKFITMKCRLMYVSVSSVFIFAACSGSSSESAIPTAESSEPSPSEVSVESLNTSPVDTSTNVEESDIWHPALNTSWQWHLNKLPVDQSIEVEMYDIDLFDTDSDVVAALHAQGRIVICYMNAGGWEDWRPDAESFPREVIGKNLDEWEGENWLDIRQIEQLAPIMEARLDLCEEKGFDGVEPDNVDGFQNDTGFPLSYNDQLAFNIWLATEAHERGLSIGLKNDMDQIPDLLEHFDWALNEQCFEYDECETLLPFIEAGKPVFNVEYELEPSEFCDQANALNFNSMKKNWNVDAWRAPCR